MFKNKRSFVEIFAVAVLLVFIGYLLIDMPILASSKNYLKEKLPFLDKGSVETVVETPKEVLFYETEDAREKAVIKAVEEASPSVVSIIVSKDLPVVEQCPYDPYEGLPQEFRQLFGGGLNFTQPCEKGTKKQEIGGGSGFVISEDGLILTNKHVVSDEEAEYTVLTNDGKKYDAKVLARDSVQDLAVLKIEITGLKPLKLGDSDSLKLGQTAIVIGNALGEFRNTVSVGVISGLLRQITASDGVGNSEDLDGLIQTDAAINSGNSGGPLLNLRGEVIGISVAIVSGAQSVGFAIPINKAKNAIESVKLNGKIVSPYLGVRYLMIDDQMAEKEQLSVKKGALIRGNEDGPGVLRGSPAEKIGLRAEDIILELNSVKIDENNSLGGLVQRYMVGDKVNLKVLREGNEMFFEVVLGERPN